MRHDLHDTSTPPGAASNSPHDGLRALLLPRRIHTEIGQPSHASGKPSDNFWRYSFASLHRFADGFCAIVACKPHGKTGSTVVPVDRFLFYRDKAYKELSSKARETKKEKTDVEHITQAIEEQIKYHEDMVKVLQHVREHFNTLPLAPDPGAVPEEIGKPEIPFVGKVRIMPPKPKRTMSAAARRRISLAQKRRWKLQRKAS